MSPVSHSRRKRLSSGSLLASLLLCVAGRYRRPLDLAAVDAIGTGVVLDGTGALGSSRLGCEGVAVDGEWTVTASGVLDGRCSDAADCASSTTALTVALTLTLALSVALTLTLALSVTLTLTLALSVALTLTVALVLSVSLVLSVALPLTLSVTLTLALTLAVTLALSLIGLALTAIAVLTVVLTLFGSSIGGNCKVLAVLLRSSLSDRHQDRLVVGGTRHGADAVVASGKTAVNDCLKVTLAVSGIVDTLEEGKLLGIKRLLGVEAVARVLDGDVGVADDLALAIELLRGTVVCAGGVGEGTKLHVLELDLDVESGLGLDDIAVLGVYDDGGDHVVNTGDISHGWRRELSALEFQISPVSEDLRIPLQDPPRTCRPLVSSLPLHSLMKLAWSLEDS